MGKLRDNFTATMWIVSKTDGNCGMTAYIVQTSQSVTLVGAGQASKDDLDISLAFAPYLIAADGGAELVLKCGRAPKKIIGDFDSIDRDSLAKIPENCQHRVVDQDFTDFEKCLRSIQAPLILGVGFLGGRLDHQLAAMNALARHRGTPCILIGDTDLVFHLTGDLVLPLEPGVRISMFPMSPVRGSAVGLTWPIDGLDLSPGGKISTSNSVQSNPVHLSFPDSGTLVILGREHLATVIQAIFGPTGVPGGSHTTPP